MIQLWRDFDAELLALRTPENAQLVNARVSEFDDIEAKYRLAPPDAVIDQINSPWPSERVVNAIRAMTWRLVRIQGPQYLIATDNPAHYFEDLGIGRDESELTFPVSPELAIVGNFQGINGTTVEVAARTQVAKQINYRQIAGAERFVFTHRKAAWIEAATRRRDS